MWNFWNHFTATELCSFHSASWFSPFPLSVCVFTHMFSIFLCYMSFRFSKAVFVCFVPISWNHRLRYQHNGQLYYPFQHNEQLCYQFQHISWRLNRTGQTTWYHSFQLVLHDWPFCTILPPFAYVVRTSAIFFEESFPILPLSHATWSLFHSTIPCCQGECH